jgi:hypothetical protein
LNQFFYTIGIPIPYQNPDGSMGPDAQAMIAEMDKNGDGAADWEEVKSFANRPSDHLKSIFAKIASGRTIQMANDPNEIAQQNELFDYTDSNNDQKISIDEMGTMLS